MELIKQYKGAQSLKHIQFNFEDEIHFIEKFKMSSLLAKKLCSYLKKKNTIIDFIETYDGQSSFKGFDFIIECQNLSLNGFCFNVKNVEDFLNDNVKSFYCNYKNKNNCIEQCSVCAFREANTMTNVSKSVNCEHVRGSVIVTDGLVELECKKCGKRY
jgi:hypothetical protein